MTRKNSDLYSGLPQPPDVEKRLRFTRSQFVGMPILFALSLLALLGVFDHASTQQVHRSEQVEVTVDYPTRFNYNQPDRLHIHVRNLSMITIPTVTVGIEDAYLRAFSEIQFTPAVDQVEDEWFQVHFNDVSPEGIYGLLVEFHSQGIGPHSGRIRVQPEGSEAVEMQISTFIFP
jgi:hypothetical protein